MSLGSPVVQTKSSNGSFPLSNEKVTFTNVSSEVGLGGVRGSSFAWGDYDADDDEDLLVDGWRLFRNNGPPAYDFTEVTASAGLSSGGGNGVWGDYNNDGCLDIYANRLWRNNCDGTFTDVTVEAGNVRIDYPYGASGWGDYDRDGFLDLYVAGAEYWNNSNTIYFPDVLWHNNGDGTFTNVTDIAGIGAVEGVSPKYGRGVEWGDYNNDGWLDIYVSNYRLQPNYLWNNNGDGTFTNVSKEKGVAGTARRLLFSVYYGHTIGSAWADIDNDEDLDLFTANLVHKDWNRCRISDDSKLYRNNGPATNYNFTDIRKVAGIPIDPCDTTMYDPATDQTWYKDELFSGVAWADYDNDGDLDLFFTQVYFFIWAHSYLYRNNGDLTFSNVTDDAGVSVWDAWGTSWADYDNDGDMDLVVGGSSYPNKSYEVHLFRNEGTSNSWLKIKLVGCVTNKCAIGARVKVIAGSLVQIREVEGGMGTSSSQNSLPLEFGFGGYAGDVDVEIRWTNGSIQKVTGVSLNQTLIVFEPCIEAPPTDLGGGLEGIDFSDVNITWLPSKDDEKVANYTIYYSTSYNRYGFGYKFLASLPPGSSYFVHRGVGKGDPNNYFYYVQANTSLGRISRNETQVAKFTKTFPSAGRYLVSIPVFQEDPRIEKVLQTLEGGYDILRYYDASDSQDHWKAYMKFKTHNDLVTLDTTIAFWMNMTSGGSLAVVGRVQTLTSVPLKAGWKLVGFPSFRTYTIADLKAEIGAIRVEGYDANASPYYLKVLPDNYILKAGEGYWIYMDQEANWLVGN